MFSLLFLEIHNPTKSFTIRLQHTPIHQLAHQIEPNEIPQISDQRKKYHTRKDYYEIIIIIHKMMKSKHQLGL